MTTLTKKQFLYQDPLNTRKLKQVQRILKAFRLICHGVLLKVLRK